MPLPDMVKSARYMKALRGKLNVGIIEASSLTGLSQLSTVGNIDGVRLAGNFPDLGELRSFKQLRALDLIGGSTINLGPVGALTQLRELVIQQPHYKSPDLSPLGTLVNLERLSVYGCILPDIPALRTMTSLRFLDLTQTPVADLTPLRNLPYMNELIVDQRSIPALKDLGAGIKALRIRHQNGIKEPMDLTAVASLRSLKTVEVWAANSLVLAPLVNIPGLSDLSINGTAVSFETFRDSSVHLVDPGSIGELHALQRLVLTWVDISDTRFMAGLGSLEEVYLDQIRSLNDVRTLGTLQKLRTIQLATTSVVDISPFLNLRGLKVLTLQETPARYDTIIELQNRGVIVKQ